VEIFDLTGKLISPVILNADQSLNIREASGTYFLKITAKDSVFFYKVIVE